MTRILPSWPCGRAATAQSLEHLISDNPEIGSSWSTPIWYRGDWRIYATYGWPEPPFAFCHDDYDGAEDGNDRRCGTGDTVEECKREIDEMIEDEAAQRRVEGLDCRMGIREFLAVSAICIASFALIFAALALRTGGF